MNGRHLGKSAECASQLSQYERTRDKTLVVLLLGHYEKNIRNLQIGTNYAEVV